MKRLFVMIAILLCVVGAAAAQDATPEATAESTETQGQPVTLPESSVTVELDAETITAPETVNGGLVTISYVNNGADAPVLPLLLRLNEGVTPDQVIETAGNPFAIIELASSYGGGLVMPGSSMDVTYQLGPGTHMILNLAGQMPVTGTFNVETAPVDIEVPPVNVGTGDYVTVDMDDFAFSLRLDIAAGEHVWRLLNTGEQLHEIVIMPVDPNTTIADYDSMAEAMAGGGGEEPPAAEAEPVFAWVGMSSGQEVWFTLDLQPGTYALYCFFPDMASGHPHSALGMVQIITVE